MMKRLAVWLSLALLLALSLTVTVAVSGCEAHIFPC